MTRGAEKHGDRGYLEDPDGAEVYFAKVLRHLTAWRLGHRRDVSGLPHLAHAAADLLLLAQIDLGGEFGCPDLDNDEPGPYCPRDEDLPDLLRRPTDAVEVGPSRRTRPPDEQRADLPAPAPDSIEAVKQRIESHRRGR